MARNGEDEAGLWLADLPPTTDQNWSALAVTAIVLIGFTISAPFAKQPLVELNALFPSLDAIVFVMDLITAGLLYAQFSINRSRALLALAIGYLFTALIVVPHALTFSGAFSATGLLNASIQTGSYLFIFWHIGFALALMAYAILRRYHVKPIAIASAWWALIVSLVSVTALVCFLTWLSTAGEALLPRIVSDQSRISGIVIYPIAFTILILAAAGLILASGRRSVLDQWLMVVALVTILELVFSGLIPSVRFSLGFYAGRVLAIITSSIVLIVLLAETTWLYVRLAWSNAMLRRERENKLMNMEAMIASIAHEVRQPLGAISINGDTASLCLAQTPPDITEAASAVRDMVEDSHRVSETLDNLRSLFGTVEGIKEHVELNSLVLDVLRASKFDFKRHGISSIVELAPKPLFIVGNTGQLRELIHGVVQNAMESMTSVDGHRTLRARTELVAGQVVVSIEDTGYGVSPEKAHTIFDAFVTTKAHGRGLGLAICRMIVERHGGQLSVSPAKQRGAVFRISLPSSEADALS
jgi:signal transduction histidine kinase